MDREAIGGNSPPVIVEFTADQAEFLRSFMEIQISSTLLSMNALNMQGKLKHNLAKQMFEFNEKAKAIKLAVAKGIKGDD